jgi:mono/diheme cytochrome c family protein
MNRAAYLSAIPLVLCLAGCAKKQASTAQPAPAAYGTAIVVSSGDKQVAPTGALLNDPVVVQVNDASGNGVTGAPVWFEPENGTAFEPAYALTDSSGQVTTNVNLGGMSGNYKLNAHTQDAAGKRIDLAIDEVALGYEAQLGRTLNEQYCVRCHNPESTAVRVSNYDNLTTKPHPFTEGETLNKMSSDDLIAIISHGGPGLNKSSEMPPFGYTLNKKEVQALVAYIRAVADPPYQHSGVLYAKQ